MFKKIKQFLRERVFSCIPIRISFSEGSFMYGLIAILIVIGPLFFIPVRAFSIISSKGFLIFFVGILGLLAYGIHVLRRGVLIFPRQKIFIILLLIVITGAIGSALSPGFVHSFLGYGFETTTWLFLALFSLMVFISYLVINSYKRIGIIYGGMLLVFVMFAVFHVVRYAAGPMFADMGVLGGVTTTLIGSWGDLGIFFGFIALLCVVTLELAGLKKSIKWVVGSIGAVSVVLLMAMNINIIWIVLGLVSLVLALYLFSFAYWDTGARNYKKTERVPWFALALFTLSVVAMFFGGIFHGFVSKYQNLSWTDMRPSLKMTLNVTGKSLVHNFATGYGPNNFSGVWSLVKPVGLSGGDISRTDFNQGVGFIPTQIATNGVIGAILWIGLFILIMGTLVKKTKAGFAHSLDRYFAIGIGISIAYLGVIAWVYTPGSYLLILFAVLIGSFISLFDTNENGDVVLSFIKDPRASFFGILGVTTLIVGTLFLGYIGFRKVISFVHYTRGMVHLSQNQLVEANNEIAVATSYANHDIFYHQSASFALSDVAKIVSGSTPENKEQTSKQVEQVLGIALANAQAATRVDSFDYKNWVLLGDVYRSMVSLGVADAYDLAINAYKEAEKRNPNDSTMVLYYAQLELSKKNTAGALEFIKESINKHPTPDAYIVRAQIQLDQQKFDSASESLKAAVALDPYNANLAYQYGLLLLKQKNYNDAIAMFQRTILIDKNYAMAYVYLGYAHERVGSMTNADEVYNYVRKQFPGGADAITAVKRDAIDQPEPEVVAPTVKK